MADGLHCISKLADPIPIREYAAPHVQWQSHMLTAAPNPEAFRAGRLSSCVQVMYTLLSSTSTLTKPAKTVLKWVTHGIKLIIVPVQHPMVITFTEHELRLVAQYQYSSMHMLRDWHN